MIEELKTKLIELLNSQQVDLIIGYKRSADGISAQPCFVKDADGLGQLIWDAYCVYNLCVYLKDFPGKKIAIFAKACDSKAITVLLQENQLKKEDIFIIAVECSGVVGEIDFAEKCKSCKDRKEKPEASVVGERDEYEPIRKMEAKSLSERFKFWQEEFSRCIRCYGCRQICPMCYCPKCVAEQSMPAWFSKGVSFEGNFSWNTARAMHLAGRCIDCGECERACPVGIPLRDINKKIEKEVKELFKYQAGLDAQAKPFLSCFDNNDPEEFIR